MNGGNGRKKRDTDIKRWIETKQKKVYIKKDKIRKEEALTIHTDESHTIFE